MNNRLRCIASCIIPGKGFVDIGTDHGYLPIHMAQHGYPGNIIASDINIEPLNTARRHAAETNQENKIRFLHCDGLDASLAAQVDTIVIAGMGGDTICGILDRAEWCMTPVYQLILQPMSKAEVLRYWLSCNDFLITNELLVEDSGTVYQVICACYGQRHMLTDSELFCGTRELAEKNSLYPRFRREILGKMERQLIGLSHGSSADELARLSLCREIVSQLHEQLRKEGDGLDSGQ